MKKILMSIIITTFLYSCSSDSNENINQNSSYYRLVEKTEISNDGDIETTNYEYYSNGNLRRIINDTYSGTYIGDYIYDNEDLLIKTDYGEWFSTYSYNSSGLIEIATNSPDEEGIITTREYTYNSLGQKTIDIQYDNNIYCCETEFVYNSNGNISEINSTDGEGGGSSTGFTYDNKKRPEFAMGLTDASFWIDERANQNNILDNGNGATTTYEYNDQGYPTKSTIVFNFMGNIITNVINYQYETIEF
ncbi:hypothetical protein [Winogradskyella bathintestinalis]|uniref:YD repeat-containing protein n=1 Tax=Winogradskyella bathintestinalis TaxID=3035208 RepID=A0ABT7ZVP6_9FLAO|nr:hypothetical protein [Winogradskyella bathintestinalis]MDN3493071.1 hypothetical protein [Winogradskyella bathintestinalis]